MRPGHAGLTELVEQEAADHGANDAEQDVDDQPLTRVVDDLAANEAGDQAKDDPSEKGHGEFRC